MDTTDENVRNGVDTDNTTVWHKAAQKQHEAILVEEASRFNESTELDENEDWTNTHLRHNHRAFLNSLLKGKLPRNPRWAEIVDLIGKIGEVQPHVGDRFVFVVGTQSAFFKGPSDGIVDDEEVSRLRKFLHEAIPPSTGIGQSHPGRAIVVIDHHAGRVYLNVGRDMTGSETTVKPYDPYGFHRRLVHRKEPHYEGDRVPEPSSFYEELARDIVNAEEIILIGHATGKSSAVDYLAEYLKEHYFATFQKIIAIKKVDLSSLSERQIEHLAMEAK